MSHVSTLTVIESLPPVSQDLWNHTSDRKTKISLRNVSDEAINTALISIKTALPKKIIELNGLIAQSKNDENCVFHPKWDTQQHYHTQSHPASPLKSASFSVLDISQINITPREAGGDINQDTHTTTTTTRRISISQSSIPNDCTTISPASVFKTPTNILKRWQILGLQTRHILELLDSIQLYLVLKTPIAEEGNNTGVEIQQQCSRTLAEARRFIAGCDNYLKLYHTQRAKLASKCIKYPQLEDYQRALCERDLEESRDCRYLLSRFRVQCLAVLDILHKNFEKVDDPKGLSRGGVTIGMY